MKRIILYICSLVTITGCSPDTFLLNINSDKILFGKILSAYGTVDVPSGNSVLLRTGGVAAIRRYTLTQHEAQFSVNLKQGSGIRFSFRTSEHNRENHDAIIFDYTENGCEIYENGRNLLKIDTISAKHNVPALIKIKNDGKYVKVSVDCADIYFSATNITSTEWIILEALEKSEILVYGIEYSELAEDGRLE